MLFAGKIKYASALVPVLIASAMMFTGCSGKNKTSNKKNSASKGAATVDYDVTKQVTLGDYSNLKLTITGDYSEETYLKNLISSAGYKAERGEDHGRERFDRQCGYEAERRTGLHLKAEALRM